ncbi:hypothetical protein [Methanosarcina spelaei]|nr:hypothetical protein [Methanosarcina spelaei]
MEDRWKTDGRQMEDRWKTDRRQIEDNEGQVSTITVVYLLITNFY